MDNLSNFPLENIKDICAYAAKHVPFYKRKWPVFHELKSYSDFTKFPVIHKAELREGVWNRKEFISDEFEISSLSYETTSGSTGIPLFCFKSKSERIEAGLRAWQVRKWWDPAVMGKNVVALCPWIFGYHKLKDGHLYLTSHDISEQVFHDYCKRIKEFNPGWMYGVPSAIYQFARFLRQNPAYLEFLNFSFIELQGEHIIPSYRKIIEETFNCGVSNQYGCIELWVLGYTCPTGNLHIIEDDVFFEILDDSGNPLRDGEVGTTVVTSLKMKAMPFIRYVLGDKARILPGRCNCGNSWRIIELLGCRTHQIVISPSGALFDGDIFHQILNYICRGAISAYVNEFKVIQKSKELLHVYFSRGQAYSQYGEDIKKSFANQIRKRIHEDLRVEFYYLEDLKPKGKFNYFESEITNMSSLNKLDSVFCSNKTST